MLHVVGLGNTTAWLLSNNKGLAWHPNGTYTEGESEQCTVRPRDALTLTYTGDCFVYTLAGGGRGVPQGDEAGIK